VGNGKCLKLVGKQIGCYYKCYSNAAAHIHLDMRSCKIAKNNNKKHPANSRAANTTVAFEMGWGSIFTSFSPSVPPSGSSVNVLYLADSGKEVS